MVLKGTTTDALAVGQLKTSKDDRTPGPSSGQRAKSPGDGQADVGKALRNAFQATVDEKIPDELLDLLRRLD